MPLPELVGLLSVYQVADHGLTVWAAKDDQRVCPRLVNIEAVNRVGEPTGGIRGGVTISQRHRVKPHVREKRRGGRHCLRLVPLCLPSGAVLNGQTDLPPVMKVHGLGKNSTGGHG